MQAFFIYENPTLDVGFKKALGTTYNSLDLKSDADW